MRKEISEYFNSVGIEYFTILSYDSCIETNKRIIDREGFLPASIIIYLLPYYSGETVNLSRYAASLDYHIAIKEINSGLCELLLKHFPTSRLRGYGDHSPINERHAALIGGLGISGDNGLIINEKYGSYVFIGDVITDIDPLKLGASVPIEPKRCEGCGICKASCPTGILCGEGKDCLSAITQRKGDLTDEEKDLMRKYNILWGCDECQRYCPHNLNAVKTPIEFFYKDRIPCLTEELLDSMSDEDFEKRAFAWRKRKTIERNLDILANK